MCSTGKPSNGSIIQSGVAGDCRASRVDHNAGLGASRVAYGGRSGWRLARDIGTKDELRRATERPQASRAV